MVAFQHLRMNTAQFNLRMKFMKQQLEQATVKCLSVLLLIVVSNMGSIKGLTQSSLQDHHFDE